VPVRLDQGSRPGRATAITIMKRRVATSAMVAGALLAAWLGSRIAPGTTRLDLSDGGSGRSLASLVLRDGERIELSWRNSLFGLDVTEVYLADGGRIVQTEVTFADPRGSPPPRVRPQDVDDLYHTGGAFSAQGLYRPLTRVVYRVGEIGNPRMRVRDRVIEFKREVAFGGTVVLTTSPVRRIAALLHRF
jgi:hypothetical protein